MRRDHQLFPGAVPRHLEVGEAEACGCHLVATAQPTALATSSLTATLLLGQRSSWGSPQLPAAPVRAVPGSSAAIPWPVRPVFEQLSSEGMLMPSDSPSEAGGQVPCCHCGLTNFMPSPAVSVLTRFSAALCLLLTLR